MERIEITQVFKKTLEKHCEESQNIRSALDFMCSGNIKSLIGQIQIENSDDKKRIGGKTDKNTNWPLRQEVKEDLLKSFIYELIIGKEIVIKPVFSSFITISLKKRPNFLELVYK